LWLRGCVLFLGSRRVGLLILHTFYLAIGREHFKAIKKGLTGTKSWETLLSFYFSLSPLVHYSSTSEISYHRDPERRGSY